MFFDDEQAKQKKIWTQINPKFNYKQLTSVFLSNPFYKKSKKQGYLKTIMYCLTQTGLYQVKEDEFVSGLLQTDFVKLELLNEIKDISQIDKNLSKHALTLYGFKLIKNQVELEIYTPDYNQWKNWKNVLIYKCILTTFHEDFNVNKLIGKGSFAKVYLATKIKQNVSYAVKSFNKQFLQTQKDAKEALKNEIMIMRQLDCEHLLKLYEVYETKDQICLIVDIVSGGELLQNIRLKKAINEIQIKLLLKNILLAIDYLHDLNIMHRDLKLENILLKSKKSSSDIIIADFGLASYVHQDLDQILFKRCGTAGFIAPEVLTYKDGDPIYGKQCDIFSIGVIFYIILTGKQPFQAETYSQILKANTQCIIDYSNKNLNQISLEGNDLLHQMLNPNPKYRISAKEALNHPYLQQYIKSEIIQLPSLGSYEIEYLINVRNKQKNQNSLHSTGNLAINGNTETVNSIGSLKNVNQPVQNQQDKYQPQQSIFKRNSVQYNAYNRKLITEDNVNEKDEEEERKSQDGSEYNYDIGQESSPLYHQFQKLKLFTVKKK